MNGFVVAERSQHPRGVFTRLPDLLDPQIEFGKGDIIDIPAGVPHWVSKIDGKELVYLTVKVTSSKP